MRRSTLLSFLLSLGVLASAVVGNGEDAAPDSHLVLSKMGIMYVGGRAIPMQGGGRFGGGGEQTQIVEQAPVHYLIPPEEKQQGKRPVVMIPGMGLTSYLYLATPDGREGWAQIFAKAGYPVYVLDEPNNAVSGFDVGKFNAVRQGQAEVTELPGFMLWSNEIVWRRWGFGPETGVPFEDTRYPVKHVDQLYRSMTPVYGAGRGGGRRRGGGGRGGGFGSEVKTAALLTLLEKTGPATLVVHSASGATGFSATRDRPDLVKALVAVEVVGSPTDAADIKAHFSDVRFIGVFGDHFDARPMAGRHEACETTAKLIEEAGGKANVIWLPKLGINGNTHLLMQDTNNDEIAGLIMDKLSD